MFQTTHKLDFYQKDWYLSPSCKAFKVGTCEGIYDIFDNTYRIIAIVNDKQGNGHFEDVLEWFENSAKRDGYKLAIVEIWNKRFKKHLIKKRGFKPFSDGVIKDFSEEQ